MRHSNGEPYSRESAACSTIAAILPGISRQAMAPSIKKPQTGLIDVIRASCFTNTWSGILLSVIES
jgi:hypothetical protein